MKQSSPYVIVISTAWGNKSGGINSFSKDLCIALARLLTNHKLACVCAEATEEDMKEAHESGLELIIIPVELLSEDESIIASTILSRITSIGIDQISWWLGHDAITGGLALTCAKIKENSRSAVIMHMSYEDYFFVKHGSDQSSVVARKSELQKNILRGADFAFAVGPLLTQRLREIRGSQKSSIELIPGLILQVPEIQPTDRLQAITFGRFESKEYLTKQVQLSVNGYAESFRIGFESQISSLMDSSMRIIGTPPKVIDELRKLAEGTARRVVNLKAIDFIEDRERLRKLLIECNVCLMPSWHEGFGLSAWEAIGSGIPVIISKNTGIFKLLNQIGGIAIGNIFPVDVRGRSDGKPNSDDTIAIRNALISVASDIPKALTNARSLRSLLRFQRRYTWDQTALHLAKGLELPVSATMLDDQTLVDRATLLETEEIVEGLEIAKAQRNLALAENHYLIGEYDEALKVLESIKTASHLARTFSIAMDATLLEAEVRFRLNHYHLAKTLADKVAKEALDRADWLRYIRARSVENGVLRDQGYYDEAMQLANELLRIAKQHHIDSNIERLHRLVARSSAFTRWDLAIKHAEIALDKARKRHDHGDEAKAALALGEGYRHGLNQELAIKWYKESRDLAGKAGNVDCFLWAVLGLADSLFLLEEIDNSAEIIERLGKYVQSHIHPLESLHQRLSLLSIAHRRGENVSNQLETLLTEYELLAILWPREYTKTILENDFTHPKRF